jgi:hypothetical protein
MSFPYLGSACLNFTRAQAKLKDELKNRAQAQAHNKSSRAELVCELTLIFNLIFLGLNTP